MSEHVPARSFAAATACYVLLRCARARFFQHASLRASTAREAELRQVRTRIEAIRKEIHADAPSGAVDALTRPAEAGGPADPDRRASALAGCAPAASIPEQKLAGLKTEQAQTQREVAGQSATSYAAELEVAYAETAAGSSWKTAAEPARPRGRRPHDGFTGYFGRARAERSCHVDHRAPRAHLELLGEAHRTVSKRRGCARSKDENAKDVKALAGARFLRTPCPDARGGPVKLRTRNDQLGRLQSDAQALEKLVEQLRQGDRGISGAGRGSRSSA